MGNNWWLILFDFQIMNFFEILDNSVVNMDNDHKKCNVVKKSFHLLKPTQQRSHFFNKPGRSRSISESIDKPGRQVNPNGRFVFR